MKKLLKDNMWLLVFVAIAAVLSYTAYSVAERADKWQQKSSEKENAEKKEAEKGENADIPKKDTAKELLLKAPPIESSRAVAGVVIVVIVFVVLAVVIYANWDLKQKWYQQKIWRHHVAVAAYILIAGNLVIFFLLPKAWTLAWNDTLFFWSLNIGIMIFVGFLPISRTGAYIFGAILVIGLVAQVTRHPYWEGVEYPWSTKGITVKTITPKADVDTTLLVIGECESGNRHVDDKGNVIRNTNGTDDPSDDDIGRYQINLKHQADIIKESGLDVYNEEEHRKIAEIVLSKKGIGQWNSSRGCWEPKLAAITSGERRFELTINVQPDEWSETVKIPPLTRFNFHPKTTERRQYLVKTNNDDQKIFTYGSVLEKGCFDDTGAWLNEDLCLPPPVYALNFQTTDGKPLEMVIKFFPHEGN